MRVSKAKVQTRLQEGSSINLSERVERLQELQERLGHAQHSALHKILHLRSMRHGKQAKVPLGLLAVTGLCDQKLNKGSGAVHRSRSSIDRGHVYVGCRANSWRKTASRGIGACTVADRTCIEEYRTCIKEYWTDIRG